MNEQFYVLKNGEKLGPFSRSSLQTDWAIGIYDGMELVLQDDRSCPLKEFLDQGTIKTEEEKKIESMLANLPKPQITRPSPTPLPPPVKVQPIVNQISRQTSVSEAVDSIEVDNEEISPGYLHAKKMLLACLLSLIPLLGVVPAWLVWQKYKTLVANYHPEDTTATGKLILFGRKFSFYGLAYSALSTFLLIASWGHWRIFFDLPLIVGLSIAIHGWILVKVCGVLVNEEYTYPEGILMSLRTVTVLAVLTGMDALCTILLGSAIGHFVTIMTDIIFLAATCYIIMASSDIFRSKDIGYGRLLIAGLVSAISLEIVFHLFAHILA